MVLWLGGGISRLLWVKGIDRDLFLGRVFFGHLLDFVFVRFWFIQLLVLLIRRMV